MAAMMHERDRWQRVKDFLICCALFVPYAAILLLLWLLQRGERKPKPRYRRWTSPGGLELWADVRDLAETKPAGIVRYIP